MRNVSLKIRLTREVKDCLVALATKNSRSMNGEVVHILLEALELGQSGVIIDPERVSSDDYGK